MSNRRSRRKMTVDELFETDHYRSIIILTEIFGKNHGLRQMHYRWSLIKNHGDIKNPIFRRRMKGFYDLDNEIYKKLGFSNKLEGLYAEKIITRNCVTSNTNLSSFLKRLISDPYNILEKKVKDDVPYYFLTDYGREQAKRWQIIQLEKGLDASILDDVEKAIWRVMDKKIEDSISFEFKDSLK